MVRLYFLQYTPPSIVKKQICTRRAQTPKLFAFNIQTKSFCFYDKLEVLFQNKLYRPISTHLNHTALFKVPFLVHTQTKNFFFFSLLQNVYATKDCEQIKAGRESCLSHSGIDVFKAL